MSSEAVSKVGTSHHTMLNIQLGTHQCEQGRSLLPELLTHVLKQNQPLALRLLFVDGEEGSGVSNPVSPHQIHLCTSKTQV